MCPKPGSRITGTESSALYRVLNHYPSQDEDHKLLWFDCLKMIKAKRRASDSTRFVYMLAYVYKSAVVIKTQLEVPDNRLCNVVTLSGLPDSDEASLPCAGKV